IHTGSRGFGHQVGEDYMREAKKRNAARSPSPHLCFLDVDSEEGKNYIGAMYAAANFAFVNRQILTAFVRSAVRHIFGSDIHLPSLYDVPHNMAKKEHHFGESLWVHRKGATRAFPPSRMQATPYADVGQPVLIPGSMGTASYVLVGTEESAESLHSVNHGAGRVMSRSAAIGRYRKSGKKGRREAQISDEEFDEAMEGILLVCEDKRSIKEEAPMAYKDIDEVVRVVTGAGLAKAVARMVPLAVLKG
ncbi:MAG: RtcB family protein, partial [Planctomycetota bacterium]|nr:RtcB family protein [Planctomycetota bacterium]